MASALQELVSKFSVEQLCVCKCCSTELKLNMHALLGIYRCPSGFEGERCDKVLSQLVMHTKNTDPFACCFSFLKTAFFTHVA